MFPALALLFFLSGACALIYQVLWLRLLGVIFGVTVYAATAVLASFMAGLALGSAIGGRLAARTRSPLRAFGVVELGIGVAAFASQPLLIALTPLYVALQGWLPDAVLVQSVARFVGSSAVLIIATTLMGATLPLVLRAAAEPGVNVGRRISVLYATNTAGAVAGVLLAGFYLIGAIGMSASFRLAAAANLAIGLVAIGLSFARRPDEVSAGAPPRVATGRRVDPVGMVVFGLSGFAALALEVLWFRTLTYFVTATTYAFSVMLASVLLGLAAGSYAATALLGRAVRGLPLLAGLQAATALAVPLGAVALGAAADGESLSPGVVSLLLVFPAALLMGASYPVGLRVWGTTPGAAALDAARVGDLNSANLAGGIIGAVVGGFVVLPQAGSRPGLVLLASTYLVTCALVLSRFTDRRRLLASVAAATVLLVASARAVPHFVDAGAGQRYPAGQRLFWSKEAAQTTAAVRITARGQRTLYLDGLHQASDRREVVVLHRLIGHLPMALHPRPARALVVGLGGGVTPGAVSQHEAAVDVVELSSAVVESAAWFSHVNYDVVNRPNVNIRVDDGRNFLLARSGRYDVITADLIQPVHAGAGHLYSVEYFRLVREALAPGGLALQWIGIRPEQEYTLILRTFLDVFPETTLWAGGQLLVGSLEPLTVSRQAFERQLADPATRAALEDVGLDSFGRLMDLYVAGPDQLRALAGTGPILTDDRPLIEYFQSLPNEGRTEIDLSALRPDPGRIARP